MCGAKYMLTMFKKTELRLFGWRFSGIFWNEKLSEISG